MTSKPAKLNLVGNYTIRKFPKNRQILTDIYDEFLKKHYMTGLLEVNITQGRHLIQDYYVKSGERISFVAWIVKCIAESVSKYPEINSFRKGKSNIVQFEDIDIVVMIEKRLKETVIAVPYSLRKVNTKSILDISREIREVQSEQSKEEDQLLEKGWLLSLYNILPKFLRQMIVRRMIKNPFYIKKTGGLIVVTSVSIFTNSPGWVLSFGGMLTMSVSLGGKTFRKINLEGKEIEQEFLQITFDIDHDIIDGAPATRFISYLVNLIETGFFLSELK